MAVTLQQRVVNDLVVLEIETNHLSVEVIPTTGGKVSRLHDRSTGREHLWRQPGRSAHVVPYGAQFEEGDISGWDECFPTIGEVVYPLDPWKGILVPDHGEVWTLPWQWQMEGSALRMWTHSVRFGYTFERTFHFHEGAAGGESSRIDVHYKVTNPTPFPLHALWSIHPFFNVSPTSRVLLPPDVRMKIEISSQARLGEFLSEIPWPMTHDRLRNEVVDIAVMGQPQPTTEKLYTTRLSEGWAALYHPDDESFVAFTFDANQIPFVGVCQIRGGWPAEGAPTYSILLEPCMGWPDRLDLAMSRGSGVVVPGGESLQWQLSLHVGNHRNALEQILARPLESILS